MDKNKDRQDPAYLTYLESQIEQACSRSVKDSQAISSLVTRMDLLESSSQGREGRKGSTNPFDDDFDQNALTPASAQYLCLCSYIIIF